MDLPVELLVLAKQPLPGRVKTRLTPALTAEQAADVARAALLDTLSAVAATPCRRRTVVLDGSPDGWLPAGFAVLPQRAGGLGDRLAAAFRDAYEAAAVEPYGPLPMLLIGMDTPQVTPRDLAAAAHALLAPGTGAVLGLAEDGGWWALGVHAPVPGLFDGVPMSTERTGAAQRARLDALGLRTTDLPVQRDLDHVADIRTLAALQEPGSALAATAARLGLLDR